MRSSIPLTGGDMSEANNNAELSGGYSLLFEALKATSKQKKKKSGSPVY